MGQRIPLTPRHPQSRTESSLATSVRESSLSPPSTGSDPSRMPDGHHHAAADSIRAPAAGYAQCPAPDAQQSASPSCSAASRSPSHSTSRLGGPDHEPPAAHPADAIREADEKTAPARPAHPQLPHCTQPVLREPDADSGPRATDASPCDCQSGAPHRESRAPDRGAAARTFRSEKTSPAHCAQPAGPAALASTDRWGHHRTSARIPPDRAPPPPSAQTTATPAPLNRTSKSPLLQQPPRHNLQEFLSSGFSLCRSPVPAERCQFITERSNGFA